MAIIKPFKGLRPIKDNVEKVASHPYDVLNSEEARIEVQGNPHSFLHVVKPEVDLPEDIDLHSDIVYNKAKLNLESLIASGMLFEDEKECFYIYAQTMFGKTQYGIVGAAAVEDYLNNVIKKHELTRPDKEEDRMNHVRVTNVNAEPVFFTYRANENLDKIVASIIIQKPEYEFVTDDEVGHHFWVVNNPQIISEIESIFATEVESTYIADGHHRTAAAALVGAERKRNNPKHNGMEDYNFFLAVHFPDNQLTIIDYNRVIKDLNGNTAQEFITKLEKNFEVKNMGAEIYRPTCLHEFSMYLGGNWYRLIAKKTTYNDNDAIGVLDVTILTTQVLEPLLDIKDLRRSNRIDFVGGIRGLGELKKRVDSGEMKVAFALYPVSMQQLMNIADSGAIMPPKTTWFEPKLRSGLVIHKL
jgi:uncharacterized protein (DUF1015 family)